MSTPRLLRPARLAIAALLVLCASVDAAPPGPTAGAAAFEQGRFEDALAAWAAEEAGPGAARGAARARLLLRKTAAYLALGRFRDGVDAALEASRIAGAAGDGVLLAEATANLGNAYLMAGLASEARRTLERALTMARQTGRLDLAAVAGNSLATLAVSEGRLDEALARFSQAIEHATAAGDERLALDARINRVRARREAGRGAEAARELADLDAELRARPDSHHKAYGLIGVGQLHAASLGDADARVAAHGALLAAARTARAVGDLRGQAYAAGYLARLYQAEGRTEEALALTRDALHAAQATDAPEILYRWQWQIGRLLRTRGETDAALDAYRRAVATLQSVRPDLISGFAGARLSFREQVGPLFLETADLLLRQAAAEPDSERLQEQLREARQTVELLKGAELADYFQDSCVAEFRARSAGIDQLLERTAALYPIILPDRTELLLSLPDGIKLVRVPVDGKRMEREIRALRLLLTKRTTHQYIRPSRVLYDWLIRPLEADLEKHAVDTLVVVPDGALRTVPLSTLHDGERFLIEKFAIATSPGLTLTDPRPIERTDVRLLASALTKAVQGFPALPDVQAEMDAIENLYGGTVLRDEAFVQPRFEEALGKQAYSIVHVASHGQFDRDLEDTFLLTWNGKLSMDALGQLIGVTAYRRQPVELLTLSACQTAAGDDRAALGLAGVAVKAGARSALATLWFINDKASSILVTRFYEHLRHPSVSKAQALQQAQLQMLRDRFYRHPIYWSPFLMIGNWL